MVKKTPEVTSLTDVSFPLVILPADPSIFNVKRGYALLAGTKMPPYIQGEDFDKE
jgi:hypothetical protein